MKIVAGLGNPGPEYESTPHSIGFEVAEAFAGAIGASAFVMSRRFEGEFADGSLAGEKVLVVKPMTFMNLSGDCLAPAVKYRNATAADLVVVSDDIDLPAGRIRIRTGGGAGGHNGLKSVIERLGSPDFTRLRIGVGRNGGRGGVIGHVLGKFDPDTRALMSGKVVPAAVEALKQIIATGADAAMNAWNGWNALEVV